jgi:GWxTD domain-containing protein
MRSRSTSVVLALFVSLAAAGAVTYPYADWTLGPVQHLLTKDEWAAWHALKTNQEAAAFVDLFWARRDPTPDTPRNEFREEFDARVQLADKQFSSAKMSGSMSDPGKVLILLGPPWQASSRGGSPSVSSLGNVTRAPTDAQGNVLVPSPRGVQPQQVWTYAHQRKPKFIKYSSFIMVFVDEGRNEWQLANTERVKPEVILEQAKAALIVSPKLTRAPFPSFAASHAPSTSFRDSAIESAYKAFRAAGNASIGPASVTWGEFVSSTGDDFLSVQIYAPAGSGINAGQNPTFVGVIENSMGDIVDLYELPVTMIASGQDAYADLSLHLDPGVYTVTFGLASGGQFLSAKRSSIIVSGLDAGETGVSPLILSSDIKPLQTDWKPVDPFVFGGLKVVPKGDALFAPKGDLWYFVELRKPGVSKEGAPSVQVQVDITGKTKEGSVEMKFPLQAAEAAKLKGETDRYAVGLAIPLEGFVPGEYTMKVRVIDTILKKNYELEKEFRVKHAGSSS